VADFSPSVSIIYLSPVLLGGPGPLWGSLAAAAGIGTLPVLFDQAGRFVEFAAPAGLVLVAASSSGGLNEMVRRRYTFVRRVIMKYRQQ
jgi:ABC-type branched-subunit amino acid transport system permease subunit